MAATKARTQAIGVEQLLEFERKGHIKTDAVLRSQAEADAMHAAVMDEYLRRRKEAYVQKTRLFAVEDEDDELYQRALKCETEDEARALLEAWCNENEVPVPFLQVFNVHRGTMPGAQAIHALATDARMGEIAASLLGVPSVRLYQTSVFMKECGHGETSWHADLATAPFDTNHMVTCWIALTPIETEYDSPLEFATGSHRDLALPYWCVGVRVHAHTRERAHARERERWGAGKGGGERGRERYEEEWEEREGGGCWEEREGGGCWGERDARTCTRTCVTYA